MKFCLSGSWHKLARPARNYRGRRPPSVLDLLRRGRISAREYLGAARKLSLPHGGTNKSGAWFPAARANLCPELPRQTFILWLVHFMVVAAYELIAPASLEATVLEKWPH